MSNFRRNMLVSSSGGGVDLFIEQINSSILVTGGNYIDTTTIGQSMYVPVCSITNQTTRTNLLVPRNIVSSYAFTWIKCRIRDNENDVAMANYSLIYIPENINGIEINIPNNNNYYLVPIIINTDNNNNDFADRTTNGWVKRNTYRFIFGESVAYTDYGSRTLFENNGHLYLWIMIRNSNNDSGVSSLTKEQLGITITPIY